MAVKPFYGLNAVVVRVGNIYATEALLSPPAIDRAAKPGVSSRCAGCSLSLFPCLSASLWRCIHARAPLRSHIHGRASHAARSFLLLRLASRFSSSHATCSLTSFASFSFPFQNSFSAFSSCCSLLLSPLPWLDLFLPVSLPLCLSCPSRASPHPLLSSFSLPSLPPPSSLLTSCFPLPLSSPSALPSATLLPPLALSWLTSAPLSPPYSPGLSSSFLFLPSPSFFLSLPPTASSSLSSSASLSALSLRSPPLPPPSLAVSLPP